MSVASRAREKARAATSYKKVHIMNPEPPLAALSNPITSRLVRIAEIRAWQTLRKGNENHDRF